MKASCPHCNKETVITDKNPFRPFCSERCRMIDLGDWLTEKNSIADESVEMVSANMEENKNPH